MKNNLYSKLGIIFVLVIALLISRTFLSGIINERLGWREQAYTSIGQSWPGNQTLAGPLLVVPYRVACNLKEKIAVRGRPEREIIKEATCEDSLTVIPKKLTIGSKLDSTMRYRGIYGVPVYNSTLKVAGEFDVQPLLDVLERNKGRAVVWGTPFVSVLVADQRGIATPPSLAWGAAHIAFQPGSHLPATEAGMFAPLPPIDLRQPKRIAFAFDMQLRRFPTMNIPGK